MKKLELAYEIIKESKKSRALYLESGRDYHKVAAHMYSIFECYAHGLIKWDTARTYWHSSILEYLNLYKDNNKLYVMESNRMLAEYEDTLKRFKPALDEYKKVSEAKMVSNIVVKKQISESVAKDHSNIYFNKRSLSESAIKDIAHTTDWKKVVESYTNLTSNDKDRLRMLTIFENDTFNVTGWSKLNEGPTLDTTQMITTVMSEAPTPKMNPADIKAAMSSSPSGMGNQRPGMVGSIAGGQIGRMAGRAIAGPIGGMVGKAIGSQIGSQVGTNIAMNRANAGKPSVAATTLSTSGSTPSVTAPATSMRPMPRPMATEDAPKTSIRPVARPGRSLPGGGYQWPNGAVEPGAGATFMTDMPRPMPRPAGLGAKPSPSKNMIDVYPPRGDMEMDPSNMEPPSKLAPKTSIRPQRRPASNVGRSEMSPTPGVWDGSTRGFESVQQEGYKTIKSIDKERYDEIPGLEGPFMTLSGKVVYYDPKEGSYYDRDTDMYLSYEEFKELDNDYSGMKNTREIKEAEEGTYMKQWYDYSEDFAMLELYVDGKLVDQWNDYFGANVTGNPLQQKFIDMAKKNGVDPIGLKVIDGEDGNEGVFTSRGLKWNSTEAKAKPGHNARAMARAQDIIRKSIEQSQKNVNKKDDKKKDQVDEAESTHWEVSYDHGPHQSNTVSVKAKSKEEALDKAKQVAKDVHKHNRITSISISPKKNESLSEATKVEIPKSRYLTLLKMHGPKKVERTPKGEMQYRGAEHVTHNKDADTSITQTYSHPDHSIATIEKHTHNPTGKVTYYMHKKQTNESVTSYEKDMDHDKAVVIRGVKGVKSTPFRKKFKNMAAYDKWSDSEEASNYEVHDVMNESALTESDIVNFSSFAGMYSDGAHAYFKGKDGKVHKVSATGDRPRKFYINGQETPWDEVKRVVGNQHIQPQQGMMHESNVNEAVTLDYSRHVRSHGKKPRDPGYSALWMFTTREYDMPDDDEVFKFQGSFADAKKAAAKWAKSQGAYRVYVME